MICTTTTKKNENGQVTTSTEEENIPIEEYDISPFQSRNVSIFNGDFE